MLNENVKKYLELKAHIKESKDSLEKLKDTILEEMGDSEQFIADDGTVAKVTLKETFSYDKEQSMIAWMKKNGYEQYVTECIDARKFNKELKKDKKLTEGLKTMYTKVESKALSVSKEDEE